MTLFSWFKKKTLMTFLYLTSVLQRWQACKCLQNGADINKTDFYSLTPLQRATEFGHADVVGYLLHAGSHSL